MDVTDSEVEMIKCQIDRVIRILDNLPCIEMRERVSRLEQHNENGKEYEEILRYRTDKQFKLWGITITIVTVIMNIILKFIPDL